MKKASTLIGTLLFVCTVMLPSFKAYAVAPSSNITYVSKTSSSVTASCATQISGNQGQVFLAYKLSTQSTYSNTTKSLDAVSFTGATPSPLVTQHTAVGLSPNTAYDFRCRVLYLVNGKYQTANGPTIRITTSVVSAAAINVSKTTLTVSEPNSQDSLSISLNSAPTSTVVLNLSLTNTSEATITPSSLTFTTANWSVPQFITLAALDDTVVDGTQNYSLIISADPTSAPDYAALSPVTIAAQTTDDDTSPPSNIKLTAVGDLCKLDNPLSCKKTADQALAINPDFHAMLGDVQYSDGTIAQITNAYDISWAGLKSHTIPVIGNHEQHDNTAPLNGYCQYYDPEQNDFCIGGANYSYSKDLGSGWTFISMESTGSITTQQLAQLNAFITAAGTNNIVLAFHEPRFSSLCTGTKCHGSDAQVQSLWNAAVSRGVDVVINGHDHKYERFYNLNSAGQPDTNGLVSFVNGMGADSNDPGCDTTRNLSISAFCAGDGLVTDPALSINDRVTAGGNLILSLGQNSFSWEFREADGTNSGIGRLVDSGTAPTRPNN